MMKSHHAVLSSEVKRAVEKGDPVVALETAVLTHGLPRPLNIDVMNDMVGAVRDGGAVPAVIGILEGIIKVGLGPEDIEKLGRSDNLVKVQARDIAPSVASGSSGGTTVSATAAIAARLGIAVMATGGIGGVHRNDADVSADLIELSRTPVLVVSSGPKTILDLERTAEALEALSIPVIGYNTDVMPAFYCRDSGIPLEHKVRTPKEAAEVFRIHLEVSNGSALLIFNPVPEGDDIPMDEMDRLVEEVSRGSSVSGKMLTPHLLRELNRTTEGRIAASNRVLLVENARLAASISFSLTG